VLEGASDVCGPPSRAILELVEAAGGRERILGYLRR
tara:strand:+ start:449 stop:556 length:108 start_codon:yes stop_codon:yes gene_type:complete